MTALLKLWLALAVVTLWAAIATYQWFSNSREAELECDTSHLTARIAALEGEKKVLAAEIKAAEALQAAQRDLGDEAAAENQQTFQEIREVVREIRVDSCPGTFDRSVQDGFKRAVDAANAAAEG